MARVNDNYLKLKAGYLFPEIARRVKAFADGEPAGEDHPPRHRRRHRPLPPPIVQALHEAVDDMAKRETFRGYGPEQGYDFLVEAIAEHDYAARGVKIAADEIFVSDGGKCDSGNIQDIFATDCVVALTDPVYPVYVDTNVMAGRTGPADEQGRYAGLVYLPCTAATASCPRCRRGRST